MEDILVHEVTQRHLNQLVATPAHAVLFFAPAGSGKGTLATVLAARLLQVDVLSLPHHAFFTRILPENNTLSIEVVRGLISTMSLKTIGSGKIRRIAIIEQAQTLSVEAQNSLLKLLEEPPTDTVILMTTSDDSTLLPTLYSRVQRVAVQSAKQSEVQSYFSQKGFNKEAIERAYLLSGGRIGLMSAVLTEGQGHPLVQAIEEAKRLLGLTSFERMCEIDSLSKRKEDLPALFDAFMLIAHAGLSQAAQKQQLRIMRQWHKTLRHVLAATQALATNAQPKLLLTNLFLNL